MVQEAGNCGGLASACSAYNYLRSVRMKRSTLARIGAHRRDRFSRGEAVARHLHVGIWRLNAAIAEYSLARLEFTLLHPQLEEPPVIQRVGRRTTDLSPGRSWADTMKRVAMLRSYIDRTPATHADLKSDSGFGRLARTVDQVALFAWSMETMHRRHRGSKR
jgi:hypothetical protein